jgi:hypothetical protein
LEWKKKTNKEVFLVGWWKEFHCLVKSAYPEAGIDRGTKIYPNSIGANGFGEKCQECIQSLNVF